MSLLRRSMLNGLRAPYLLSVVGLVMSVGCETGYRTAALRLERQPELSPVLFQDQAMLDSAADSCYSSGSIDLVSGWHGRNTNDIGFPANIGGAGSGVRLTSVPNATDATSWEKIRALYR